MIELKLNNQTLPVNHFIFHHSEHKENFNVYILKISIDEIDIITFIEKYSSCNLSDLALENKIIEKDKLNKSMGLLWQLKVGFFDKIKPDETYEFFPVLNNITKVVVQDGYIIFQGQASI